MELKWKPIFLLFSFAITVCYNGCGPSDFEANPEALGISSSRSGSSEENQASTDLPNSTRPNDTSESEANQVEDSNSDESNSENNSDSNGEMSDDGDIGTGNDSSEDNGTDNTNDNSAEPGVAFYFGNQDISNAGTPAFIMTGDAQSTMYSCDGGRTWKGYSTPFPNSRCGSGLKCDHQPHTPKGITWGKDGFMATFGWGSEAGGVFKTQDGITWSKVKTGNYGGIAYGNGKYAAAHRYDPVVTDDGGSTWGVGTKIQSSAFSQRSTHFFAISGLFASFSSNTDLRDIMLSADGMNYSETEARPATCGEGRVAQSPNRILLKSESLCTSDDGGLTWVDRGSSDIGDGLVFNGEQFITFERGIQRSSNDGLNWTNTPLTLNGENAPRLGFMRIGFHPATGQYVGIQNAKGYNEIKYNYSNNGVDWFEVNKQAGDAPMAPHPIRYIGVGFIKDCN